MTPGEQARVKDLEAENARLREALEAFIDDDPCSFDHTGFCQTHLGELEDGRCRMVAARAALKETDGCTITEGERDETR